MFIEKTGPINVYISFIISKRSNRKNKSHSRPEHEDGTYVMLNDFDNIKICYSIGIDHNVDFDKDIASRGIEVYIYDHII